MSKPSNTLLETEETLRSVIQNLIDGQEAFQSVGNDLKDETLKHYFLAESLRRAEFRGELETILHQEGVHDAKEGESVAGSLHRVWGDLKVKLGGGDHSLLVTAEQGEDEAKRVYKEALEKDLPFPIRQLLTRQYAQIQISHDYVRAARDSSE
ncbi:MAG: PA2169 family four-helix-bundle protein [Terracidiphilus sp.]|jgi:uncharacterized protein (TIGR02284 family)